jgi:hypothetical protein
MQKFKAAIMEDYLHQKHELEDSIRKGEESWRLLILMTLISVNRRIRSAMPVANANALLVCEEVNWNLECGDVEAGDSGQRCAFDSPP